MTKNTVNVARCDWCHGLYLSHELKDYGTLRCVHCVPKKNRPVVLDLEM